MERWDYTELDEAECRRLLTSASVGRVGAAITDEVVVLPVNFVLDGSSILFRVTQGSVLSKAADTNAAFEVDGIDEQNHEGWSVLIQGRAHDVTDSLDAGAEHLRTLVVSPWAAGEKATWMSITIKEMTGRRIG